MGVYEDRLQAANYTDRVDQLRDSLLNLSSERREQLDQASPDSVGRLEVLLDHVLTVVTTANPNLVTQGSLNDLTRAIEAIRQALENFSGSGDVAVAAGLADQLDNLATALRALPGAQPTQQEITQAAETYRQSLGQRIVGLTDDLNKAQSALADLQKTCADLRADIDSKHADFGQTAETRSAEVQAALDAVNAQAQTKLDELQTEINAQKARLDEALNQVQATFADSQKSRQDEFDTLKKDSESKFGEVVSKASSDTNEHMETLRGYQKEATDLLGVISAIGTAGHYKNEADDQKRIADQWRKFTMYLAGAAGALAITFLVWAALADLPIGFTLAKAATVIGLTGIAGYAARQSARHRHREELARRLEMELVAVGPFIEALDEPTRNKIREELAPRLFGNPHQSSAGPEGALTKESVSLLQQIVDVFTGLRPRGPD